MPTASPGLITVMYGFDPSGNITGFAVMQHAETPGLGSKMDEWFSNPAHTVIGRNANSANLTVKARTAAMQSERGRL